MAWPRTGDKPLSEPMTSQFIDEYIRYQASMHYSDVILGAMASQITGISIVYSSVCSDADQRKHQSSASLSLWGEFTGDRWIPLTKGQLRGKCFHVMTSSWGWIVWSNTINDAAIYDTIHKTAMKVTSMTSTNKAPEQMSVLGEPGPLLIFLNNFRAYVAMFIKPWHRSSQLWV